MALLDKFPPPPGARDAFRDKEFCRLFDVAVAARRHQIALSVAAALRALNSPDGPTPAEIEAGEAAEDFCTLADQVVADYQRRLR
jgi:hypothetical protein